MESYMVPLSFESKEHNLSGLWPWEDDAIRSHFQCATHLLIAAAGGGRETLVLARRGFSVTAFDCSKYLTAACREIVASERLHARILDSPPDDIPNALTKYDGLIIGRGAYHHIPGKERRIRFLKLCCAHLKPGSRVLVLDFFVRKKENNYHIMTYKISRSLRWFRRSQEHVDCGDWVGGAFFHAFVRDEIDAEFGAAGLDLEHFIDTPFGPGSSLAHAVGKVRIIHQIAADHPCDCDCGLA
jgi:cyclopropane fatty-acyl-phospholipid synthase-like methyltransferase